MNLSIQLQAPPLDGAVFAHDVLRATGRPLVARAIDTVQVNIGLACDLACHHCHVESSPRRTERMDWPTMLLVLDAARRAKARTIDITGGAPELHPRLREFIGAARDDGRDVIVRTNLTILLEQGYDDFPAFYAANRVHLIASLPCFLETNVDRQRGLRVYEKSVEAMRRLNAVGYGIAPALPLDLVYNPGGPALPPDQSALEADYRRELDARFGLRFRRLITITNMPIGRFLHDLRRDGKEEAYVTLLRGSFNPATVERLMCRSQIHVGWDGTLHDCDFNYAQGMAIGAGMRIEAGVGGASEAGVDRSVDSAEQPGQGIGGPERFSISLGEPQASARADMPLEQASPSLRHRRAISKTSPGQEALSQSGSLGAGSSPMSETEGQNGLIADTSRQGEPPAAQVTNTISDVRRNIRDAARPHIRDFDPEAIARRPIATGSHCYGCTAGHGSSCGGALA